MSAPSDEERSWRQVGEDRIVNDGHLPVVGRTYELPDGSRTDWELLGHIESVGVLALTDDGRVVLVREFRPGPGRVVANLPSGMVEPGEAPDVTGARELTEETGYVAESVETVASIHAMAHGMWVKHVVIARGCRPTGKQDLGPTEDCEPVVLDVAEVRALARSGAMVGTDLVYLALDHANLL